MINLDQRIVNEDEFIGSISYQFKYLNPCEISDVYFEIIPQYDLDYLIVKMDIMGGDYLFNNGEMKRVTNIYPNYEPISA